MTTRTTAATGLTAAVLATSVLCGSVGASALTPTSSPSPTATATSTASPTATASPSAAPTTPAPTASATRTATPTSAPPTAAPTASTPTPTTAPATSAPPVAAPTSPAPTTAAPTTPPVPAVPPPVATRLSSTRGHASNSRTVTLTGSQLLNLRQVLVAGVPVSNLVVLSPTSARFVLPNAIDYQAKVAPITLTSASDGLTRPTALTFTYVVSNRLDRQMAYAFKNWNAYSNRTFGYLSGNDCANFASQTLLARGWARSAQWFNYGVGRWSPTWVSTTALSNWLKKRPDLAQHLIYRQRDLVQVGDIVQFRWPGYKKGYQGWDHTAIVSKVVVLPDGRHDVYYVAHTLNRQYGGSTQALATYMAKDLKIQFFHLLK